MSPTLDINDLRRDATALIAHRYLLAVRDLQREVIVEEEDIRLIGDNLDGDNWTGHFSCDADGETIYEVSYKEETGAYYITKYVMFECEKIDPSMVLYSE
jgi:hypothetical protein